MHVRESTGYFGPSERQQKEFKRIVALDWKEFSEFCMTNPRYRGDVPDFGSEEPLSPPQRPVDYVVLKPEAIDPKCPYVFPLSKRHEIEDFIARHPVHNDRYDPAYLAWNVKVHSLDTSGRHADFETDAAFDERWEKHLEKNGDSLFWECCEAGLSQYLEGCFSTYEGGDEGRYKFHVEGRSGGWLCLTSVDGHKMAFRDQIELKEYLQSISDEDLVALYKAVVTLDTDLASPGKEVAFQMASRRALLEEEWKAENTGPKV
jgi:hypothetical protein